MSFDAIVIGARCAGAPTAMLLSRAGLRVLLVDRAGFPSDYALSTHLVWSSGARRLEAWGLLDVVRASGTPALTTCSFTVGGIRLRGQTCDEHGVHHDSWAPRRIVLDQLLVDAAVEAGAELRERTTLVAVTAVPGPGGGPRIVSGVMLRGPDGRIYMEQARLVIGADGRSSAVARHVGAEMIEERPSLQGGVFGYWRDVPVEGIDVRVGTARAAYAWPTNGGLTLIGLNVPVSDVRAVRAYPHAHLHRTLADLEAPFVDAVRRGQRVGRWVGLAGVSTFHRRSHGPGWLLIGDAGYAIDPGSAQGISDAFRDADSASHAIITGLDQSNLDDHLAAFEAEREQATRAMCELTYQMSDIATPPPPDVVALQQAIATDQSAIDRYFGVLAGLIPVESFFAPERIAALMAATT